MAYTNLKEIGRGGMGAVFSATDSATGRKVAIKMMSNKVTCYDAYRRLFKGEVQALKRMDSPNVVHIVGETYSDNSGNLFIPMEFIEGETISQRIHRTGAYSESGAKELMCKILDAFTYIHGHNCIHRDIKPSNIMIRPDGSICVIDFGIAKDSAIGSTGHTVGMVIGTDGYMSPEQVAGLNIDIRTDIYSLGCLLFYLCTGHDAIVKQSNDHETRMSILNNSFPSVKVSNPNISKETEDIIYKAVNKDMRKRYKTALEFKQALQGKVSKKDYITIGSLDSNDIVMNHEYVSREHLRIRYDKIKKQIIIEDVSSNGTAFEGRKICKESASFNYVPGTTNRLPEVLLVGMYPIDWKIVISKLNIPNPPPTPPPIPTPNPINWEKVIAIIFIVIFCLVVLIAIINS